MDKLKKKALKETAIFVLVMLVLFGYAALLAELIVRQIYWGAGLLFSPMIIIMLYMIYTTSLDALKREEKRTKRRPKKRSYK